jgi:methyl-accepting chemotaxis protein
MIFLSKTKIGTRLMLGFCVILFLAVITGAVSLLGTYSLYKTMMKTLDQDAKLAELANSTYGTALGLFGTEKEAIMKVRESSESAVLAGKWSEDCVSLRSKLDILAAMIQNFHHDDEKVFVDDAKTAFEAYSAGFAGVAEKIGKGDYKSIDDANRAAEEFRIETKKLEFVLKGVSSRAIRILQTARDSAEQQSKRTFFLVSAILLASVIAGVIISMLISSSIRSPLNNLSDRLRDISEGEGDLTMVISVESKDETGILAGFFNSFVSKIRGVVRETKDASSNLMSTSKEMHETAITLSENIRGQAASAEEISATMDEVSSGVDSVAGNVDRQYDKLVIVIGQLARLSDSINVMNKTVSESMDLSKEASLKAKSGEESVNLMTESMTKITESSEKISGIISIINDISDKINLLSLNAAIEAARAGDAGRGFAVVADEISKLADQTSQSIKEIDMLVHINAKETSAGHTNINKTNIMIHESIDGVNTVVSRMDTISELMKSQVQISVDVDREIKSLKDLSEEIKISTSEQKNAFSEIIKSIGLINELSQSNAGSSQHLSEITNAIEQLSQVLDSRVNFFKV